MWVLAVEARSVAVGERGGGTRGVPLGPLDHVSAATCALLAARVPLSWSDGGACYWDALREPTHPHLWHVVLYCSVGGMCLPAHGREEADGLREYQYYVMVLNMVVSRRTQRSDIVLYRCMRAHRACVWREPREGKRRSPRTQASRRMHVHGASRMKKGRSPRTH
jgi:hypothetical protein